jgi:hypothetical protein
MRGNLYRELIKKMPKGNTLSWSMKYVLQLDEVLTIQLLGHDGSQEAKNLLAELVGESASMQSITMLIPSSGQLIARVVLDCLSVCTLCCFFAHPWLLTSNVEALSLNLSVAQARISIAHTHNVLLCACTGRTQKQNNVELT